MILTLTARNARPVYFAMEAVAGRRRTPASAGRKGESVAGGVRKKQFKEDREPTGGIAAQRRTTGETRGPDTAFRGASSQLGAGDYFRERDNAKYELAG